MKLRYGYLISGVITGCIILFSFIFTLPDGKLHIVFCDVGQGDAAYIRFPDGHDMVIDGGPSDAVLHCLGRHMPFWDRHIDIVSLTHPQKDHMQGIISILKRYSVGSLLRSDVTSSSDGFALLQESLRRAKTPVRFMSQGNRVQIGAVEIRYLWPSQEQIAKGQRAENSFAQSQKTSSDARVLGAQTGDLNDYSLVQLLQYKSFDVLFTGDADDHVEDHYTGLQLGVPPLEVLKVPHHGSKTGMTGAFVDWASPLFSIVSVGKNSYGHPSNTALDSLNRKKSRIVRTDERGDIEIVSDGIGFTVTTQRK